MSNEIIKRTKPGEKTEGFDIDEKIDKEREVIVVKPIRKPR